METTTIQAPKKKERPHKGLKRQQTSKKERKEGSKGSGPRLFVKDMRSISKKKAKDERRLESCESLFKKGFCPFYTYTKKKEDLKGIATYAVRDKRTGHMLKRRIAKWLWVAEGDHSLGKFTEHDPTSDPVKPVNVAEILDAILFMMEDRFVKRREGTQERTIAPLTRQQLKGSFSNSYKIWMDAAEELGIIERMREHSNHMKTPSGKGNCRGYVLNRWVSSDHSRAYWNTFTARQSKKVARGDCEHPVDSSVRECLANACVQLEAPDPDQEEDPTQRAYLRTFKEEKEKAFETKTDHYGQRTHYMITSLRKDLREELTFSGHLAISVDLSGCFLRALARGEMGELFSELLGDDFKPDTELARQCMNGDPYEPLTRIVGDRDEAKKVLMMALAAPTYRHNSFMKALYKAYPQTAKNVQRAKEIMGHQNFLRELQAVERKWMKPLLDACVDAMAPALPIYDEVIVPEWMVPELEQVAKENGLEIGIEGGGYSRGYKKAA